MSGSTQRRVKVMFLAWGDSIHARRRIGIFTEDPAFDVAVVSTFAYGFQNARNYLLTNYCEKKEGEKHILLRDLVKLTRMLLAISRLIRILLLSRHILKSGVFSRNLGVVTAILLSPRSDYEMQVILKDYQTLSRAFDEFRPDVIFLQTLLYPCYLSYLLPQSVPVVITFWNGDLTWWAQWRGLERVLKKEIVKYGVRRATSVTVNSQAAFDSCLDYGAPTEKVHLIRYPGVDTERFKPGSKENAKRILGVEGKKVVLCPRGLGGYLNSDTIIEAVAGVVEKFLGVLFLFVSGVGSTKEWEDHLDRARELGVEKNLRRDGAVAWEKMPTYYQAADAMVSISSNDSLPNCMLEAMAVGVPVVMGDIPQIRAWIKDGENGLLVDPRNPCEVANALVSIFEDSKGIVADFASRNYDLVRREFDGMKNCRLVKELVRDIADRSGRSNNKGARG